MKVFVNDTEYPYPITSLIPPTDKFHYWTVKCDGDDPDTEICQFYAEEIVKTLIIEDKKEDIEDV